MVSDINNNMFDEAKDNEETIEFVVLLNSVPIHFHKSANVKTALRKYYTIAHNKNKTTEEDEDKLDRISNKLIRTGQANIKKFLFLKFNNINLSQLKKKD